MALAQLPRELLDRIAGFLPTDDFNNLRLSCKQIENLVFAYWANCFFTTRQHMISSFSLNALLDISRHPILSKCITHLAIGLDDLNAVLSCGHRTRRQYATMAEVKNFHTQAHYQTTLIVTGEAVRLLSAAVANLPNLEYVDLRDYASPTRYRDRGHWTSYGSSIFDKWCPPPRRWEMTAASFFSQVFQVVVTALGHASSDRKSPITRLETISKGVAGLCDNAFALIHSPHPGVRSMLHGLTTLHLNVGFGFNVFSVYDIEPSSIAPPHKYNLSTIHLQKFLNSTPNITWLRINNFGRNNIDNIADIPPNSMKINRVALCFFHWLALRSGDTRQVTTGGGDSCMLDSVDPVVLPLKRLDLGSLGLPVSLLMSLFQKYSDLEHLSLFRASTFTDETDATTSGPEEGLLWPKMIRKLPAVIPGLKTLELFHLHENGGWGFRDRLVFVNESCDYTLEQPPPSKLYVGASSRKALDQIADSCKLYSVWVRTKEQEDGVDVIESDEEHSDTYSEDSEVVSDQ